MSYLIGASCLYILVLTSYAATEMAYKGRPNRSMVIVLLGVTATLLQAGLGFYWWDNVGSLQ